MRFPLLLFLFFICNFVRLQGQGANWTWSTLVCPLDADDRSFLVEAEKKLLATDSASKNIPFFKGAYGSRGYKLIEHWATVERNLGSSEISKIQFRSCAELCTIWNTTADTCMIVGFQPMIHETREEFKTMGSSDSTCYMHVPLYFYRNFLEEWRALQLHELTMNSFAAAFGATRKGDSLIRMITFKPDSNEYLPQASYEYFAWRLVRLHDAKKSHNIEFTHWMSHNEFDTLTMERDEKAWPKNFIYQGMWTKGERVPEAVVLYEIWIPEAIVLTSKLHWPWPYLKLSRKVCAYGLRYRGGKVAWIRPEEVLAGLPSTSFNWSPYEESFRAERFQTMHIALEP